MTQSSFYALCGLITASMAFVFLLANKSFLGPERFYSEISFMEEKMRQQSLRHMVAEEGFKEFQRHVASLLPQQIENIKSDQKSYPLRNLASIVQPEKAKGIRKHLSNSLFDRAKKRFRDGDYSQSISLFDQIIRDYSFSPHLVESMFLRAEALFQEGDFEACAAQINAMVEQFPENELTGLSMIRLGRIFEIQSRSDEAVDIYRTALLSFPFRSVASQAKASLKGIAP